MADDLSPRWLPAREVAVSRGRLVAAAVAGHPSISVVEAAASTDAVAVEAPVALVFNGLSHAVMMATPADLEALALGFALSEGLIGHRGECRDVEVVPSASGLELRIEIASSAFMALKQRRRSLEGRTGCGLCGIESLQQLDLAPAALPPSHPVNQASLMRAFADLPSRQTLNAVTGACHAAAWARPDGTLDQVMEDVGRHNALDKLLGARAAAGSLQEPGFVIMSSRASFELVRKCARLGIGALAAISAPTSLAVDIAIAARLQLYGFCRGTRWVRYTPALPSPASTRP